MSATTYVHCGQLVTLAGPSVRTGKALQEVTTIADAAFTVEAGKFTWVGRTDEVTDRNALDLQNALVTPGLVDAHTHTVFGGDRVEEFGWRCAGKTYQEIASLGGGIHSTVAQTRNSNIGQSTKQNQIRLVRAGTTTFETKTGYGLDVEVELEHLAAANQGIGTVSRTWLPAHAVPKKHAGNPANYIREIIDGLPAAFAAGADSVDAFIEPGYFSESVVTSYLQAAKQLGLKIRVHVDQLGDHGGAAFAARIGATTADHLEHTSDDGIRAMADAGVIPVLLPASVFGLGLSRYPNARRMIEAGLPIVLASDFNPGSSPCCSLPFVMAIACRMMKLTPEEALNSCTINAAASLGLAGQKGSIEVGKDADFVCWSYRDYRELAYWFGDVMPSRVFMMGSEFDLN